MSFLIKAENVSQPTLCQQQVSELTVSFYWKCLATDNVFSLHTWYCHYWLCLATEIISCLTFVRNGKCRRDSSNSCRRNGPLYFHNFFAKSDKKTKTKNGINKTIISWLGQNIPTFQISKIIWNMQVCSKLCPLDDKKILWLPACYF